MCAKWICDVGNLNVPEWAASRPFSHKVEVEGMRTFRLLMIGLLAAAGTASLYADLYAADQTESGPLHPQAIKTITPNRRWS